jgi:sugar-specific transcriptional regulator TrmB
MISVNKETLSMLKRLGLNQYEARTYLALVNNDHSTATQISDLAEIPRPRVYDVLAKLVKKGFAVSKPARPTKYKAVPLKAAVSSLKKQLEEEHQKSLEEVEALESRLAKLLQGKLIEDTGQEEVYVIRGRKSIYSLLGELIQKSKKRVVISTDREGLKRKKAEYNKLLEKAENRGVNVTLKETQHRAAIVDDNALLFLSESRSPKNEEAAWIKSPFVASSVKDLIETS